MGRPIRLSKMIEIGKKIVGANILQSVSNPLHIDSVSRSRHNKTEQDV